MRGRTVRRPQQRSPAAACSALSEARRANRPRRSAQGQSPPRLPAFHARCAPELVELLGLRAARHVPANSLALLPDPLALDLPGGFLRDLAQKRGEADIARACLRFESLSD